MKTGLAFDELISTVEKQELAKRDFRVPTSRIRISAENGVAIASINGISDADHLSVGNHARRQVEGFVGVPGRFADHLLVDHPDLYERVVGDLISRSTKGDRLVRVLDERMRAFLSPSYRIRDNVELLSIVLPALKRLEGDGLRVDMRSTNVSERKMYIKCTFAGREKNLADYVESGNHTATDDIVRSGFVISNSEIGCGRTEVKGFVERLVCKNGLIVPSWTLRQAHIGRRIEDSDEAREIFSDEAREADDRAFMLKFRDAVLALANESRFDRVLREMVQARGDTVKPSSSPDVIEEVTKRFSLMDRERDLVLDHMMQEGDYSRWGLINAITRSAEDVEDYDRATELEELGGKILQTDRKTWEALSLSSLN